jgi:uncharacterized membrane protein YdjX (TVP38/TMEM64 family)
MVLAWQGLVPLAFVNVVLVMFVKHFDWPVWILSATSVALFVGAVALNGKMLQRRLQRAHALNVA